MAVFVCFKLGNRNVKVLVTKETNFRQLKEILRDKYIPMGINADWGKLVEKIRDTAGPELN